MTVSNIAATGYNPAPVTQTMGNMVDLARGIQGYQTGQIQQQKQAIDLQAQQQANQERQNVIQLVQNDPDFKPGPDGIIDQSKVMPKLMAAAPQTYSQYAQNINTANAGNVTVNSALTGLDKETRDSLSSIAAAGVGQPRSVAAAGIQEWMDSNSTGANKSKVQMLGNKLLTSLNAAGDEQPKVDSVLQMAGLRTKAIGDIINARQPGVGMVNQGTQVQPTVELPNWSGKKQGEAVGQAVPMGVAPYAFTNQYGQQAFSPGMPPRIPSTTGATGGTNPSRLTMPNDGTTNPSSFQAKNIGVAQDQTVKALDPQNTGAIQQSLSAVSHLKNIIGSSPVFSFGPGTQWTNEMRGVFGGATNPQEAGAYLDRLAATAMAQSGIPQTNAGLAASQSMTGNVGHFNQEALMEKVRQTEATLKMANDYNRGLSNAVGYGSANNWAAKQGYDAKFASANPDVWRFESAIKNNDTAELARLVGPNGAYKTADDINDLAAKRKVIQSIIPGF